MPSPWVNRTKALEGFALRHRGEDFDGTEEDSLEESEPEEQDTFENIFGNDKQDEHAIEVRMDGEEGGEFGSVVVVS